MSNQLINPQQPIVPAALDNVAGWVDVTEIGPNQRAAIEAQASADEERARQESAARQEEARQKANADGEKARQESNARQEEARQKSAALQYRDKQRTLRFAVAASTAVLALVETPIMLWMAAAYHWPIAAYGVIASLGGLTMVGGGLVAARQTGKDKNDQADELK